MVSIPAVLGERVQQALGAAFGAEYADTDPLIRPSQFADLQSNVALSLAKRLGANPREVAARLVDALAVDDLCAPVTVSGPGFLNLTLREQWLADQLAEVGRDARLGTPVQPRSVVVIDYSAPNVAKEMHVGHLRTTVVGDALARTLEFLGHKVIRQNHIGDWGTPFGMLIEHLLDVGEDSEQARALVERPNDFYQAARQAFDADEEFATRSRRRVVALQAGDPETLRLWHELIELSTSYFNSIYARLAVTLTDADLAGESTYNERLPGICDELEAAGIATTSEGALCVFLPGFTGREGKPVPLIIRKSDGGYGYATTDLATIKHRTQDLLADRLLYVIGAPQHLHLQMMFETARLAGWVSDDVEVVHVQIGNVLGGDGKILRTRSGAPIRLMELLDEAVQRAGALLAQTRPDLAPDVAAPIAAQVGIGAVKYADLQRRARQRVHLRLRPDARADRQHRPVPAVRRCPGQVGAAQGRPGRRRGAERADRDHRGARARAGPGAARPAGRRRAGGSRPGAAPAVRLPVRAGPGVHPVLRAVPGAARRGPRRPDVPAGPAGPDGSLTGAGVVAARNRVAGTDVGREV